ncbi:MAG TPA: MATE family efflux transporter [Thermotogota bacterium]|nr:MATE family efflux transporter [Thermotogota bacterium]HPJ89503.1 MATE family efflux transporter [Thermotogota bacterium]HPR96618.1 MATE family efflux transporter [Thermotogota bacterium]
MMPKYSLFKNYLTGDSKKRIRKEVFALALPAMGENVLQMILGIVDTAFLGHLHWTAMTAAGMANQILFIFQAAFMAISIGATVLISNALGVGNRKSIRLTAWNGTYMAIILGGLVTAAAVFSGAMLVLFPGVSKEINTIADSYLKIILFGGVGFSSMYILSAILRGSGDTKTPMIAVGIANSVNLFLDYAMIFGNFGFPALGAEGAAIATVISRFVGTFILFTACLKSKELSMLGFGKIRFSLEKIKEMLKIGIPTAIENLLFSIGSLVFANILMIAGEQAYAAHRIGINIESISFMPGFGVSVAITTLVGIYNGKDDRNTMLGVVRQGWIIGTTLMVSVGLFITLFPEVLIVLFTTDKVIAAEAVLPVRLLGLVQFFLATDYVMTGAFRGVGDTKTPMFITSAAMWGIRIPVGFILVNYFDLGLLGAWSGMMLDMAIRGMIKWFLFSRGKWEKFADKTRDTVHREASESPSGIAVGLLADKADNKALTQQDSL